jgi:hypothetical protein
VLETLENQPAPDDAAVRVALLKCRDVLSYFDSEQAVSELKPAAGDSAAE